MLREVKNMPKVTFGIRSGAKVLAKPDSREDNSHKILKTQMIQCFIHNLSVTDTFYHHEVSNKRASRKRHPMVLSYLWILKT